MLLEVTVSLMSVENGIGIIGARWLLEKRYLHGIGIGVRE